MKRIICVILLYIFVLSLCSCALNPSRDYSNMIDEDSTYYEEEDNYYEEEEEDEISDINPDGYATLEEAELHNPEHIPFFILSEGRFYPFTFINDSDYVYDYNSSSYNPYCVMLMDARDEMYIPELHLSRGDQLICSTSSSLNDLWAKIAPMYCQCFTSKLHFDYINEIIGPSVFSPKPAEINGISLDDSANNDEYLENLTSVLDNEGFWLFGPHYSDFGKYFVMGAAGDTFTLGDYYGTDYSEETGVLSDLLFEIGEWEKISNHLERTKDGYFIVDIAYFVDDYGWFELEYSAGTYSEVKYIPLYVFGYDLNYEDEYFDSTEYYEQVTQAIENGEASVNNS